MAQAWQSVEEAAVTLGISTRTLHRRITRGEIPSRLENGRREVLVDVPDPKPVAEARAQEETFEAESVTVSQPSDMAQHLQNTVLALHEDRLRRTDLAILAYQQTVTTATSEARRSRLTSRFAWGTAGGLIVVLFIVGLWSAHRLTAAQAEVQHIRSELQHVSEDAQRKESELERLRREAEEARLAAARAEGELTARRTAEEKRGPTTRPTLLQSLANALSDN